MNAAFIIGFGVILLMALLPYLLANYESEQLVNIQKWVNFAVRAAEMIYTETKQGTFKKVYVLDFIKKKFKGLTADELEILIEGVVKNLKDNK